MLPGTNRSTAILFLAKPAVPVESILNYQESIIINRGQQFIIFISRFHGITRIDPVRHATMAYTNQVIQPLHIEAGKGCLGTAP